jgi:hypothetical protein
LLFALDTTTHYVFLLHNTTLQRDTLTQSSHNHHKPRNLLHPYHIGIHLTTTCVIPSAHHPSCWSCVCVCVRVSLWMFVSQYLAMHDGPCSSAFRCFCTSHASTPHVTFYSLFLSFSASPCHAPTALHALAVLCSRSSSVPCLSPCTLPLSHALVPNLTATLRPHCSPPPIPY